MFQIGKIDRVSRKVEFDLPADDGKEPEQASFTIIIKLVSHSTIEKRQKGLVEFISALNKEIAIADKKSKLGEDYEFKMPDSDTVDQHILDDIVGFGDDVKDVDGNIIKFSKDALKQLLDIRYVRKALVEVWAETNQNTSDPEKEEKEKNS